MFIIGLFKKTVTAAFDAIYLGPTDYGARVTVDNFDVLIAHSEEYRRAFLAANPWLWPERYELVRRTRVLKEATRR